MESISESMTPNWKENFFLFSQIRSWPAVKQINYNFFSSFFFCPVRGTKEQTWVILKNRFIKIFFFYSQFFMALFFVAVFFFFTRLFFRNQFLESTFFINRFLRDVDWNENEWNWNNGRRWNFASHWRNLMTEFFLIRYSAKMKWNEKEVIVAEKERREN